MDTKIRKIFVLLYPLNDFSKRMYEYIQGRLAELAPAYAVVETGGVGYLLHISLQTYSEIEGRSEVKALHPFRRARGRAGSFRLLDEDRARTVPPVHQRIGRGRQHGTHDSLDLFAARTAKHHHHRKRRPAQKRQGAGTENRPEDHRRA